MVIQLVIGSNIFTAFFQEDNGIKSLRNTDEEEKKPIGIRQT